MNYEIERKYLVSNNDWKASVINKNEIYQGYLSNSDSPIIRVRKTNSLGFLTIKDKSVGLIREEYEYQIPLNDAISLLGICKTKILRKNRYTLLFGNLTWEIDEFLDDNEGLIIAEVELSSIDMNVVLPSWIGREVTNENIYYNKNLLINPYLTW